MILTTSGGINGPALGIALAITAGSLVAALILIKVIRSYQAKQSSSDEHEHEREK